MGAAGHAVLSLRGLDVGRADRMAKFLNGYATSGGRVHIPVDYGDSLFDSYAKGVEILNREIHAALARFDRVTVMAHSRGADVAGRWIAKYAGKPGAPDPARLDFVLLGNPARRYGGDGPGARTPDNTSYQVVDITRRWDRYGNKDNWPGKPGRDALRLLLGAVVDHGNYEKVRPETCTIRAVAGNTRYLIAP